MAYLDELEIKLIEKKPVRIVSLRDTIAVKDYCGLFAKVQDKVIKGNLSVIGTPITVYHDKEFDPESSDIEIGIPVKELVAGTRELVGGLMVSLRVKGEYSAVLPSGYVKLVEWIETNGYQITAAPYEEYLTNPNEVAPEENITDIYFPIKKK